jgi:hypothetical protein
MLPDDILHDLWTNVVRALREQPFVGINEDHFHATMPDMPFGDAEVRHAAAFLRQQGTSALAIRLQCGTVEDHILIAGRSDDDLRQGQAAMSDGLADFVGASLRVLDHN